MNAYAGFSKQIGQSLSLDASVTAEQYHATKWNEWRIYPQFNAMWNINEKNMLNLLLSFLGIMCHVGIDVGTNTTAPKILMERLGMSLNDAAFATSLYYGIYKNCWSINNYGGSISVSNVQVSNY